MTDKKYIITEEMIERIWRQFCRESPELVGQWVYEMRSNPLSVHEATIAAKVRGEVLDELLDELPNIERSYLGEQIDTQIETRDLKQLIKSLRSNPPEREGE
jgi:hypothetical protein